MSKNKTYEPSPEASEEVNQSSHWKTTPTGVGRSSLAGLANTTAARGTEGAASSPLQAPSALVHPRFRYSTGCVTQCKEGLSLTSKPVDQPDPLVFNPLTFRLVSIIWRNQATIYFTLNGKNLYNLKTLRSRYIFFSRLPSHAGYSRFLPVCHLCHPVSFLIFGCPYARGGFVLRTTNTRGWFTVRPKTVDSRTEINRATK